MRLPWGIERLKILRWKEPKSCLSDHEQSLEEYFRAHPPHTVKQARSAIIELSGETLSVDEVRRFFTQIRCAKNLGIILFFLPPYSPNLNLIERLWKYTKKDMLANRYFELADFFHEAVLDALNPINHCPKTKEDFKSLITHNFNSFAQKLTQ